MSLIRPVVPVMEYAINYDYIREVLCINKYNPEQKCNGKCHLKKELDDVFNDKDSKRTPQKNNPVEEVVSLFCQKIEECNFFTNNELFSNKQIGHYKELYSYNFCISFFHPPCKVS